MLEWIRKLYEKLAFQQRYDVIKTWKLSPAQQELSNTVWTNLSPAMQKALWSLVALILAKFGVEKAQSVWMGFINSLKKEGITIA